MLRTAILGIFILIGCSTGKPTEAVPDSVVTQPDTVTAPIEEPAQPVAVVIDTTYEDYVVEDNPLTPQLDPVIAYVHNRNGIDVYEASASKIEKVIGHLNFKDTVRLVSAMRHEAPLEVGGMKGYYALIRFEDRMAYVFTGWILNLPVPEEPYILDYFLKNFHLEKAEINKIDTGDSLRPAASWRYFFEQGITIEHKREYESEHITISIPGMTMQQGWLLANYYMPGIDTFIKELPTDSGIIRSHPDVLYKIETRNGKLHSISHTDTSGCYNFISFTDSGKGVIIVSSGGC